MNRYLKHKKQEEEALKRKQLKLKEKQQRIILKERLFVVWEWLKDYFPNYVEVKSPYSKDLYLVEKGKEDLITFETKPEGSIRFSDHWDWIDRRNDYQQCEVASEYLSKNESGKKPKQLLQISIFAKNRYYTIAGEFVTHKGNKLVFIPKTRYDVCNKVDILLRKIES